MDLPDFLTRWPNGEIVLTGHRIGLYSVIDLCQQGFSPDQIRDAFPSLAPELIRSVIAFHEGQRAEVDAFVAEYRADLDSQEVVRPVLDLLESDQSVRRVGLGRVSQSRFNLGAHSGQEDSSMAGMRNGLVDDAAPAQFGVQDGNIDLAISYRKHAIQLTRQGQYAEAETHLPRRSASRRMMPTF